MTPATLIRTLAAHPCWRAAHIPSHEYHHYQHVRDQLARACTAWPSVAATEAQAMRSAGNLAAARTVETWLAITARSKARQIDLSQHMPAWAKA